VMIEGPSGCGKSDLALRMMDAGFVLVADDQTLLWTSGGELYGRAPDALSGLIESRGCGVLAVSSLPYVRVSLMVDLDPAQEVERIPERETRELLGKSVPLARQQAFEASAPAKIRRWLMALGKDC